MAQTSEVRGVQTSVSTDENNMTSVIYRGTTVVKFDQNTITLNSNGYTTSTTKTRMTQATNQFNLGYGVFQKDFTWYVDLPNGETVNYFDNMVIDRNTGGLYVEETEEGEEAE